MASPGFALPQSLAFDKVTVSRSLRQPVFSLTHNATCFTRGCYSVSAPERYVLVQTSKTTQSTLGHLILHNVRQASVLPKCDLPTRRMRNISGNISQGQNLLSSSHWWPRGSCDRGGDATATERGCCFQSTIFPDKCSISLCSRKLP